MSSAVAAAGQILSSPRSDFPEVLSSHPAFNLRTDPFAPIVWSDGKAERFRYDKRLPLDPQICREHLQLYFDVYDWQDKDKLDGLKSDGRLTLLRRPRPDHALVVLISGFSGCGRSSALNLLLYEIRAQLGDPAPIEVNYSAQVTSDTVWHAREIAMLLRRRARELNYKDLVDQLGVSIEEWEDVVKKAGKANPDTLFSMFKDDIKQKTPGCSVIVTLDARDHKIYSDFWRPVCQMLSQLAAFIVVSLSDCNQAKPFRRNLTQNEFETAWLDAPKVTQPKLTEFLAARLAKERVAAVTRGSELAPFTLEALDKLYEPGSNSREPVTWPIAVAMAKLSDVFTRKCATLSQAVDHGAVLSPSLITITGEDVAGH